MPFLVDQDEHLPQHHYNVLFDYHRHHLHDEYYYYYYYLQLRIYQVGPSSYVSVA